MSFPPPEKKPPRRILRWLGYLAVGTLALGVGLWIVVHTTTWGGPLVANTLRRVIGTDNVARLEDTAYAVEDRINRWRRRGEKPRAYWQVPAAAASAPPAAAAEDSVRPPFVPAPVGPVFKKWSAPGDGQWVPVPDPRREEAPVVMYKTLLHPDANRSWAELFVVAVDLAWTELRAMPGTREPEASPALPPTFKRTGRVPVSELPDLLGAFNGGFMAEHGNYGMRALGVTILAPRERSCTVVGYSDGSVEIATWKTLKTPAEQLSWFRQTPACMYENGEMHIGLRHPETRLWGATLDGDTVIRRSAIGLSESRLVLYVGISNNTTARALAEGMRHAGAVDVAQLDVNWSYPKFLTYGLGKEGKLEARAAMSGFEFAPGEYVDKSSMRDFFYILHRSAPAAYATTPTVTAQASPDAPVASAQASPDAPVASAQASKDTPVASAPTSQPNSTSRAVATPLSSAARAAPSSSSCPSCPK